MAAVEERPTETVRRSAIPSWLPMAGLVVLMVTSLRQVARPLTDPDTWWHLRLGHEFWGDWSLRDPGRLSPFATADWVPTQWLPEMVAGKAEDYFGLPGVAWLMGLALLGVISAVYLLCRQEADRLAAVVAAGAAVVGMSASLSPRPHMLTYLFLAVTLAAWLRTAHDLRARWWLVPMTWVWACSHGMWFTGALLGLAVTVGLALDSRVTTKAALRLALVPVASLLVAALTPVGPKLLSAPFAVGGVGAFITEWQAPSFREIAPAVTMAMIAVVVLTWARGSRTSWVHLMLLLMATGWTLLSVRTVTLGALLAAPLLAAAVQSWLPGRAATGATGVEKRTLGAAAVACLAVLALILPSTSSESGNVPTDLSDDLAALPAGTRILNAYELGGWLAWRHPHVAPAIDGLTEAYPVSHLSDYGQMTAVAAGWDDRVTEIGASYGLLLDGAPLATALQERMGWQVVDSDAGYVLLTEPR